MPDSGASRTLALDAVAASQPTALAKMPPIQRSAKKRKLYEMKGSLRRAPGGWKLMNSSAVFPGGGQIYLTPKDRRGFPEYAATPVLRFDGKLGQDLKDMDWTGDYWLVSDQAKTVLEQVDPDAFAFQACRVELRNGSEGPRYWLCDVVRVLDALNEPESEAKIRKNDRGEKVYNMIGNELLIFKEDVIGPHHIFRMRYREPNVICDAAMMDACKAAGLKGWSFRDTSRHAF